NFDGVTRYASFVDAVGIVLVALWPGVRIFLIGKEAANQIFYGFFDHGQSSGFAVSELKEQVQDGPVVFDGDVTQGRAGIGSDRMRNDLHQRQVVDGITVEPGFIKIFQALAERGEPVLDPLDFTSLITWRAPYPARVASIGKFWCGCHQVADVESVGNGAGDKLVGGRDNGAQVTL